MPDHAIPEEIAIYEATAFTSAGGPVDWSTNGTYIFATDIDRSGLTREAVPNENNRLTLRDFHPHILALRSKASAGFGLYMHSNPTHAAEAAAATTFHITKVVKSAIGGVDLGYSIGVDSGGTEETDEVETDADPGYELSDVVFLYDTSATRGEFYRLADAVAPGPPVTLTLDRDRHFAVNADGTDTIKAVIDCFIDDEVTSDHRNAAHTTLWCRFQGAHSEDVHTAKGCKPVLGQITIAPGVPQKLPFSLKVTTFSHETDTQEDFSAATIFGNNGIVPSIDDTTIVKLAAFGSPLATIVQCGSMTINPGVTYAADEGVGGWEGVNGYVDEGTEATTIELMVPFDEDYATAFNAETKYHLQIQIGVGADAVGFYFPRLSFASYPKPDNTGGIKTSTLSFRALKNTASVGALTGASARKHKSPMHIYFVA
jgi:hypothetical protein